MTEATSLEDYAQLFAHLRVNTSPIDSPETLNRSPNKPLLLLAVLELFEEGGITNGRVVVGPPLGALFSEYWFTVVPPRYRPNLPMPFFYLQGDGDFWRLIATPDNDVALRQTGQIRTLSRLTELVAYAELDSRLVQHLADPSSRNVLRDVLIQRYFAPGAQGRLLEKSQINQEAFEYSNVLLSQRIAAEATLAYDLRPAARAQGFRRAVVAAYDYRCSMCGIRVVTVDGHVAVEAAHIRPWSESQDDRPANGLALCRLCHWSFDEGLLGATKQRIIVVSPQMSSSANVPGHLAQLSQRPLIDPTRPELSPDPDSLSWHQSHVFRAR